MQQTKFKQTIINELYKIVEEKIEAFSQSIFSLTESKQNDTKSSAGDKYETSREMIQIEINKNTAQLRNAEQLHNDISKIQINKICIKVEFGSIVETNQGIFFISIGLGKLLVNNTIVYAISHNSPLAVILLHKSVGNTIIFQNKEISIISIY